MFHDALTNYSVQGVQLNIRPVDANLRDPVNSSASDAGKGAQGDAIRAVSFRGLMTLNGQNAFEPQRPITRLELANAMQMALAAEPKLDALPKLTDIAAEDPMRETLDVVLSNGWMTSAATFAGNQAVTRKEWALACKALVERYQGTSLAKTAKLTDLGGVDQAFAEAASLTVGEGWLQAEKGRFKPNATVTRAEVAQALAKAGGLLSL
jgi:hypothetical protein